MKQPRFFTRCLVFLLLMAVAPFYCFPQKIKVIGTGQTTGHIATLSVINNTKEPLTLKLGPFLIPATKKFQGYGVPETYEVTVPPKEVAEIPLRGFCTNPFLPPTGNGEELPPFRDWVATGNLPSPTPETTLRPADGFVPKTQATNPGGFTTTYPGTLIPFPYTIDLDEHPEAAAPIVLDIIRAVEEAYERLASTNQINTPFAADVQRQEDAVEQQVIWYALGLLTGHPYDREDFSDNLVRQYETTTQTNADAAPPEIREALEEGIDSFWETFTLVGVEAKVLKAATE